MLSQRLRYLILMTVTIVTLAACGGGGTQVAGGGIGGTGISQGSITQFGSVWVNGVEFDTTNSSIVKDGVTYHPTSLAELKNVLSVGMIVSVDGTINSDGVSGTADSVSYTKELLGPISDIPNNNSLIVLGQTVIIDDLTKIIVNGAAATIGNLKIGDTVEVSGFLTANGIRASFIEQKSPTSDVELRGVITDVNGNIITIGGQIIDISMVTNTNYKPAVGDYVEVKATNGTTPLVASSVEKNSRGLGTGSSDQAEFEGFVTSVNSSSDFMVDDQEVQTTPQTIYSGGSASDITKGTRLEINGALSKGILVASLISFKDHLTLEGKIDPLSSSNSIVLDTYPGVTIQLNDVLTEGLSTNSHNVGDYIKIRARKLDSSCSSSCTYLATELDYVGSGGGSSTPIESHADVEAVDATKYTITILGKVLDLNSFLSFSGTDSNGNEITDMTQFLNAVKPGDEVYLTGTNTNGAVTWDSIELED